MSTVHLQILHPTESDKIAYGDADTALTLRDVCVDLQKGAWLPAEQPINQLGATCERTAATLPMTVPVGRLDLVPDDVIQLQKTTVGAEQ